MPIGPSTSTSPYIVASQPNVRFTSIITVNDEPAGSDDGPFVGIPDGLGAFDNGDGTITVLINHELRDNVGDIRDHGFVGAFIDRMVIDKNTLQVVSSDDLIKSVLVWNTAIDSYVAATTPIGRLCSADLPDVSAFYNMASGLGTTARIFLSGEEVGDSGRLFATVVTDPNGPSEVGTSYELPFLGDLSYENAVANPYAQNKTIVAVTDDQSGGQLYIYIGQKQATGTEIEKAGLHGGDFYGIKVTGLPLELAATGATGSFTLQEMGANGDVSDLNGTALQTESVAEGVTAFFRPEDAAWDPDHPEVLYFVTTGSPTLSQPSRLYKLTFTDVTNPALGGTVEMLFQGLGGPDEVKMLDNISVADGKIILQEDPGNDPRLAKVWEYDIESGALIQLAQFDPARFSGVGAITQDEESSGVIDVTGLLGDGDSRAYLMDAQVHAPSGNPDTVEQGQLLVMYVDEPAPIGGNGNDTLDGNGSDQTIRGENGDDTIRAFGGNDFVYGGNGIDNLQGGTGNDLLEGERGDDRLDGGFGNDMLLGGQGSDRLVGGGDADTLTGGLGGDVFVFDNRGETGIDLITDFSGGDRVWTTVQLADGNGDGVIQFGADDKLDLFGSSELQVKNGGQTIDALAYKGSAVVDGATYYSYGSVPGGGSKGADISLLGQSKFLEAHADVLLA